MENDDMETISQAALALEERHLGPKGEPTLSQAMEQLLEQWNRGVRDRELALHVLFLSWYLQVAPPSRTGLDEERVPSLELPGVFNEAHDHLLPDGAMATDLEALHVVSVMANRGAWAMGDESEWTHRSETYSDRVRVLNAAGLDPSVFTGRGAYGQYFRNPSALAHGAAAGVQ